MRTSRYQDEGIREAGPDRIPTRGLNLFVKIGIFGTAGVVVLVFLLTWLVVPVGPTMGELYTYVIAAMCVMGAGWSAAVLQETRPWGIRPTLDGIETNPFIGNVRTIPWAAFQQPLWPPFRGYRTVVYKLPGSNRPKALYLSLEQAEVVFRHQSAPAWMKPLFYMEGT